MFSKRLTYQKYNNSIIDSSNKKKKSEKQRMMSSLRLEHEWQATTGNLQQVRVAYSRSQR